MYFRRGHTNTELYQSFLAAFDQFPWKTSNQLSGPMIPAIKDIKNLKSAHLIGKPEFGAVIESDVSKYRFPLPSNMYIEKCFIKIQIFLTYIMYLGILLGNIFSSYGH